MAARFGVLEYGVLEEEVLSDFSPEGFVWT